MLKFKFVPYKIKILVRAKPADEFYVVFPDQRQKEAELLIRGVLSYPSYMVVNLLICDQRTGTPNKFADLQFGE